LAGYETNYNRNLQSEGFSLAGKKYQKAFHDTAMHFRREQGVQGHWMCWTCCGCGCSMEQLAAAAGIFTCGLNLNRHSPIPIQLKP